MKTFEHYGPILSKKIVNIALSGGDNFLLTLQDERKTSFSMREGIDLNNAYSKGQEDLLIALESIFGPLIVKTFLENLDIPENALYKRLKNNI